MKKWFDKNTKMEWLFSGYTDNWDFASEYPFFELEDETWCLPSISDLETIIDRSKYDPAIKDNCPVGSLRVWTREEYASSNKIAWTVLLQDGSIYPVTKTNKRDIIFVKKYNG